MDYEKKYKEALERAKVIYQGSYKPDTAATIAETLQNVFPELCESEDERISKEIIKYLEQTVPHNHRDEVLKSKEWTAWLEKQGEQKPAEWKQENVEELSEFENAMMHIGYSFFGKRGGLDPNDTSSVKVQAQYLLELAQKSAEWSEEDELKRSTLIHVVKKQKGSAIFEGLLPEELINWLKCIKQRIGG